VIAIHRNYDVNHDEGVKKPLYSVLNKFQFILLEKCDYCPWKEKHAKEPFYILLKKKNLKKIISM